MRMHLIVIELAYLELGINALALSDRHPTYHETPSDRKYNTVDFLVDYGNDDDSSNDFVATQNEEVATLEENVFSDELGINALALSDRHPTYHETPSDRKYNTVDFLVDYGNDDDSSNDFVATQNEEVATLEENVFSDEKLLEVRIYKIKFRSSGEIDRYKARLVAYGFRQKEGIDYEETFSPVVKMVIVKCLLNIVVSVSWPVFQLDVNNAFLFEHAPRQWNAKLTSTLIKNGFSQSKFDYSLFLALLVYMDDIIITGILKYFLGIEVLDTDKGICLNQRKYVLDLLSECGMLASKPAKTPLMSKLVISNEASDKDHLLENITDYQKLMEKLIYLTNTRLNISYVVHCLSQFMHSPLTSHLKISFNILRYLKSCPGFEVHITKTSGMFLTAYSDADWAKCIVTRKSVTGYCVFLNNSLISWKSKKQNTLFKSSTEAEYKALSSVTNEVI
uniref:Ribonuclease H-like domain-containing protein n=1 Tax=Tanacetum cinerariifolium TaxID=118510 RepID=A0A6L2N9Q8_TANCI|nr:ribonuclease H-like domain-containing protein [Tanacetum cinerariifolium]